MTGTPPPTSAFSDVAPTVPRDAPAEPARAFPEERATPRSAQISDPTLAGNDDIFFAAVSLTRMPMVVTDPRRADHPLVFVNRAFCEMSGYEPAEVVGRNCRFMQGPDTDRASVARIREALRNQTDVAVELLNYRKDGTAFWNALSVSPVFGLDGTLRYFFASVLDITRRREAERALLQAERLEGLGSLAGGVAHEFNNLLTVIRGNLEPLLRDAHDARTATRLNRVRMAAERATTLTRSMISFARRQRLDDKTLELGELVRGMRGELAAAVAPHALQLDVTLGPAFVQTDPEQFQTALKNVLLNARDAGPRDGVVRLNVRRSGSAGEVEIAVGDQGSGMSQAVAQRAIDPFFTTKPPGEGVGLGLSMAYGFMRQTGGRLEIDSREGQGTTVRLVFPDGAPLSAHLPRAKDSEAVLVVDDEVEFREQAASVLRNLGYVVHTASRAGEALDRLRMDVRLDLLVTDIVMPGMAGPDLVTQAEALRPALRVLYATGFIAPEGRPALRKPFGWPELAREVRRALDAEASAGPR